MGLDVFFGIVAPLLCLYFDPIVFIGGSLGNHLLGRLRLFSYSEIAISIVFLAYYLFTRRASPFLAGVLYAGAAFAFFVGIVLLPLSLVMVVALIGIAGLTPLATGYVFYRNARDCWRQSSVGRPAYGALTVAVLGAVLILGVPLSLQVSATHLANRAEATLQTGSEQEFGHAVQTLKRLRFAVNIDTGRMERDYQRTADGVKRARLSRAYRALTGEDIEQRLTD
jgi:hypothetical protein